MRFASALAIALALAACKKSEPPAPPPQGATPAPQGGTIKGKVAERVDAAPYSYLRLTTAQG
ncbi:MAG TPA: nucleotide-binding protein, partial [Anaeromyxobacteraceae bacterium]|nr:nucleotide-binding protein [Anaeromyxobacteraceae bacterium]